ncbi:ATP-binding protein [Actinomadura sp. 9N407]|uniref:ATP-binding protein n=1 Tax=Actinomadura sp. 9N407 TaxID=3375154 RepID=UPI0037A6C849
MSMVTPEGETAVEPAMLLSGEGNGVAGDQWVVDLPGTAASVSLLRHWVRSVVGSKDLELVASEYGTNALWHSASGQPGGRIRAELTVGPGGIRIAVRDDGPGPPGEGWDEESLDEHGRGLALVAAHVAEVGEYVTPEGRHVMWALIR